MTTNSEARKLREGVVARAVDMTVDQYSVVHQIESEELGTGILIRSMGQTCRVWGPPSALHHIEQAWTRALESIVNPPPDAAPHDPRDWRRNGSVGD